MTRLLRGIFGLLIGGFVGVWLGLAIVFIDVPLPNVWRGPALMLALGGPLVVGTVIGLLWPGRTVRR